MGNSPHKKKSINYLAKYAEMEKTTNNTEAIKKQGYEVVLRYSQPLMRDDDEGTLMPEPRDDRRVSFELIFADGSKLSLQGEFWQMRTFASELVAPSRVNESLAGPYDVQISREVKPDEDTIPEDLRENTHTSIKILFSDGITLALAGETWKLEAFAAELLDITAAMA